VYSIGITVSYRDIIPVIVTQGKVLWTVDVSNIDVYS